MSSQKEKLIEQAEKYFTAGKYDRATKEYQKLLLEDPSDMRAKLRIADIYTRTKEIPMAIKLYREVAEAYAQENFHLKAIAVYKNILKLSPTIIEINERLGDLYHKVGLNQDSLNQYYIVASYYDTRGQLKEAMEIRKKIIAIDPMNTTGRIRLAELMQSEGRTEDSLREYERAAEVLASKHNKDGLIEVFEKIVYFKPDNPASFLRLSKLYLEKKEFKKFLKKIEASPAPVKSNPDIGELWAEALLEDHQVDAARRKFKDLYATALGKHDAERSVRLYSRILQEFNDDQDYLDEINEFQKEAGGAPTNTSPHFRQDFEKTDRVDLNQDPSRKKK